jgi:hypothetical protein
MKRALATWLGMRASNRRAGKKGRIDGEPPGHPLFLMSFTVGRFTGAALGCLAIQQEGPSLVAR